MNAERAVTILITPCQGVAGAVTETPPRAGLPPDENGGRLLSHRKQN